MHIVRDALSPAKDRGDLRPRVAIVGLGNPMRGDDAAGPLAIAAIQRQLADAPIAFLLIEQPLDLVDSLDVYESAFIVDACSCSLPAGEVVAFSWPSKSLEEYRSPSTHTMSLSRSLDLGHTLGLLPSTVRVFAVSGKEFETGHAPSEPVQQGSDQAAQMIVAEVRQWLAR